MFVVSTFFVDLTKPPPQDVNAVRRELQNLIRLKHTNIVRCFGAQATPGCTHLALLTEAILGPNGLPWRLSDFITAQPSSRLSELWTRSVAAQLACGLAYAHERGVVHRDLTLDNILVKDNLNGTYTVKLIDFGSSKHLFASLPATGRHTDVSFAAPELLLNQYNVPRGLAQMDVVPTAVDMWAMGVILLCCLMGFNQLRAAASDIKDVTAVAISKGLVPFVRRQVLGLCDISPDAKQALLSMFCEDPRLRLTALALSNHSWLGHEVYIPAVAALPVEDDQTSLNRIVVVVNAVAVAGGGQPLMES